MRYLVLLVLLLVACDGESGEPCVGCPTASLDGCPRPPDTIYSRNPTAANQATEGWLALDSPATLEACYRCEEHYDVHRPYMDYGMIYCTYAQDGQRLDFLLSCEVSDWPQWSVHPDSSPQQTIELGDVYGRRTCDLDPIYP